MRERLFTGSIVAHDKTVYIGSRVGPNTAVWIAELQFRQIDLYDAECTRGTCILWDLANA